MRFHRIRLQYYRKFKSADISFPDGLVGIVGPNGVGKSTIIEAVAWALFGNEDPIVRTSKETIRSSFASSSDPCKVELEFELGGVPYRIVREMRGVNLVSKAEAYASGRLEADSVDAVRSYVTKLLGMDYKSFFISIFARQKDLAALSSIQPNRRKELIIRMLNLDRVDEAIRKAGEVARDSNKKIEGMREGLVDDDGKEKRPGYEEELNEKNAEVKRSSESFEAMEGELEKLRADREALASEWEKWEKMFERFHELNTSFERSKAKTHQLDKSVKHDKQEITKLVKDKDKIAELEPKEAEYKMKEETLQKMESARSAFEKRKGLEKELDGVKKDIEARNEKIRGVEKDLGPLGGVDDHMKTYDEILSKKKDFHKGRDEFNSTITRCVSMIEAEEKRIQKVKGDKKRIEELGVKSECPTCERPLGEVYNLLLKKYDSEVEQAEGNIKELTKQKEEAKSTLENEMRLCEALEKRERHIQEQIDKIKRLGERKASEEDEIKRLDERSVKIGAEMESIGEVTFDEKIYSEGKRKLGELQKVHEQLLLLKQKVEQIPEIEKRIEEIERDIEKSRKEEADLQRKLEELGFSKEEHANVKKTFEEKREEERQKELELERSRGEMKKREAEVEHLTKVIDELKRMEKEIVSLQEGVALSNKLHEVLKSFKTHLIARIRPMLSEYASVMLASLTDNRYSQLEVDENYEIQIHDGEGKYPIDRFSGGEADLANLSLRLAISQIIAERTGIARFNVIVLDEIFGSGPDPQEEHTQCTWRTLEPVQTDTCDNTSG